MRIKIVIIISALALALGMVGCGDNSGPEPLTNKVYLPEKIEAQPGDDVAMAINFDNEVSLTVINVPLLLPSALFEYDSVSFKNSRAVEFGFHPVYANADTLAIGVLDDTAAVPAGRGLLATVYFKVRASAPDTTVTIGTFDFPRLPLSYYGLTMQLVTNTPTFGACRLTVKE